MSEKDWRDFANRRADIRKYNQFVRESLDSGESFDIDRDRYTRLPPNDADHRRQFFFWSKRARELLIQTTVNP